MSVWYIGLVTVFWKLIPDYTTVTYLAILASLRWCSANHQGNQKETVFLYNPVEQSDVQSMSIWSVWVNYVILFASFRIITPTQTHTKEFWWFIEEGIARTAFTHCQGSSREEGRDECFPATWKNGGYYWGRLQTKRRKEGRKEGPTAREYKASASAEEAAAPQTLQGGAKVLSLSLSNLFSDLPDETW